MLSFLVMTLCSKWINSLDIVMSDSFCRKGFQGHMLEVFFYFLRVKENLVRSQYLAFWKIHLPSS